MNQVSTIPTIPQYKQISPPPPLFSHRHSLRIIIKTTEFSKKEIGLGLQNSRNKTVQNELMKVHFRWGLTHIYTKQVWLCHKNTEVIFYSTLPENKQYFQKAYTQMKQEVCDSSVSRRSLYTLKT